MKKITLFVFLLTASFGFSQELITNGDFQTGAAGDWYTGGENNPIEIVNQGGNFVFQANVTGTTDAWRVNLSQVVALQDNTAYELSFDAFTDSATGSRPLNVSLGQAAGPFAGTTPTIQTITDTPTTYTYTITTNFDTNNGGSGSRVIFDMGDNVGFVFIDNVSLTAATVDPMTDASLSDLAVDGSTVAGFSPTTTSYTVEVPPGTVTAPLITGATTTNMNATTSITQASGVPGTASVLVTAENGTDTETYTVSIIAAGPTSAAPTPPNRAPADVISLFSNAYTDTTVETWNAGFDDSTSEDIVIFGDDAKKITFTNFLGVEFTNNRIDASAMTHFHMDFWTDNTDLVGKVFNSKFSQWGGTMAEVSAMELNINTGTTPAIVSGAWVSIDVEIATSFSNNLTRDDLAQFLITSNLGVVYVDNIYFHNNMVLNTEDFETVSFKAFPNPTNGEWNISGNSVVKTIAVYDILGKQVLALEPNSNDFTINAASLRTGVYFAKIEGVNGSQTIKLVKQ